MAKKVVQKKKIKPLSLFIVLVFLLGLFFVVYFSLQIRVKTIVVHNTTYLNDDMILELAGIKDYPKFFLTSSRNVQKQLEKSPYIKKAKLRKKYKFQFVLEIEEEQCVFYDMNLNQYVFSDETSVPEDLINQNFRVPRLLNYVPDNKIHKFISCMGEVKETVLSKISDIEYQPSDYDKDRFLLYMDDGNMVYVTLTKFKLINHYNEVLTQVENHKGILYLDNGNHFKIME